LSPADEDGLLATFVGAFHRLCLHRRATPLCSHIFLLAVHSQLLFDASTFAASFDQLPLSVLRLFGRCLRALTVYTGIGNGRATTPEEGPVTAASIAEAAYKLIGHFRYFLSLPVARAVSAELIARREQRLHAALGMTFRRASEDDPFLSDVAA